MGSLDMRTILVCFFMVDIVSTLVLVLLWFQNRNRYKGTFFWIINFTFQTITLGLIALRGQIPDWISMVVSNSLAIIGMTLGYFGLLRFLGKKINWLFNLILVLVFITVHYWFSVVHPDLNYRNLNLSVISLILFFQCFWLMIIKVPPGMLRLTSFVGTIYGAYVLINLVRIIGFFFADPIGNDYLHAGGFQNSILLGYHILFIMLTFGLVLMFNNYLNNNILKQEEKFSKAFFSAPYGILISRLSDGRIIDVNRMFLMSSGFMLEEIKGKTSAELNIWEDELDRNGTISEIKSFGKILEKETRFRQKSGEFLICLFSAEVIEIDGEKCLIASINDITRRKRMEEELVESELKLRALNASKDKFFSIIAHDLKNPFSSIIGFSSLLQERIREKDYEGIEQYSEIILSSAERAMNLLMNLLEWSRSQTGRMEFSPEYIEMVKMINEVVDLMSDTALQKSITISCNLPKNAVAFADKAMVGTILRNLVTNALKFSLPGGKIKIAAEQKKDELILSFADNGIGINNNNIKKLFRIEEGFSTPGTNNEKGTGLGLILCKEFVEKHGGKIWVESKPGKGSTFYFSLPTG